METNKDILNRDEYSFLKTDARLSTGIGIIGYGGSVAYGTNNADSDVDIRGFALNSPREILLGRDYEQVIDKGTDTTIYSFMKIISLLRACNPNVVEILGLKPEHYLEIGWSGQMLLDNSDAFLSRKAAITFGGYASQQLGRIENNLARFGDSDLKEKHVLESIKRAERTMSERYAAYTSGQARFYIGESEDGTPELRVDMDMKGYPLRDFFGVLSETGNIARDYDKLTQRNKKKDMKHLCKHMMHLIRLYTMGAEILEGKGVHTYRTEDHDLLMSIRNGEYLIGEDMLSDEFWDLLHEMKDRFDYAEENSSLPDKPDSERIDELVFDINRDIIMTTSQR